MLTSREEMVQAIDERTFTVESDSRFHRVSKNMDTITTVAGDKTPQQVMWFLEHSSWESGVVSACGVKTCLTHMRLDTATEDDLLALVQKTSVSLADLYRKGRQRGLLSARSEYR
jgi:hypothetical protein